ncbi:hypothetical protein HQ865_15580 [Mucilaginibacter mali]|uniref:Uncharacterized protein n=1 Tax=Mucilaginibacter mali TaxID=2740462 RepID=A0A7D4TW51_9SPHI|nr:formyltransferase family protein [Mucilaginibacter mali]QKJ31115.1 hypothetical protein HQ865_15580 [Mucilaginibacter mali]
MRIVLFTSLLPAFAALDQLRSEGWLKAVVSTDKIPAQNGQLKIVCENAGIKFLEVTQSSLVLVVEQLFAEVKPDAAIMFGFSYRIPAIIYQMPLLGFYNVHFSLLPAYRGPDPVFHQLKNGEQVGGVSIHKVARRFDSGDIVLQQPFPLFPGETWGLCFSRHIPTAAGMVMELLRKLNEGTFLPTLAQDEQRASYHKRLDIDDTTIKWDIQTAAQIDSLVNACNPAAGGALTFFRQLPVRVFEVSQVEGQSGQDVQPGTVIHAGADGVYVQCLNRQMLRINILSLNEGVISGAKFAALGIQAGDIFGASEAMQPASVH